MSLIDHIFLLHSVLSRAVVSSLCVVIAAELQGLLQGSDPWTCKGVFDSGKHCIFTRLSFELLTMLLHNKTSEIFFLSTQTNLTHSLHL